MSSNLPRGNEHILYIDDEEDLIDLAHQMLTHLGYTVTIQSGSLQALELFRADPGKYDLVITDLTMPELTGDALCIEMHKIREDLPILITTGFSDNVTKEKIKTIGVLELLEKPVKLKTLAVVVRRILDQCM